MNEGVLAETEIDKAKAVSTNEYTTIMVSKKGATWIEETKKRLSKPNKSAVIDLLIEAYEARGG